VITVRLLSLPTLAIWEPGHVEALVGTDTAVTINGEECVAEIVGVVYRVGDAGGPFVHLDHFRPINTP
jgi:hypothetical protein